MKTKTIVLSCAASLLFLLGGCTHENELPDFTDLPGPGTEMTSPSGPGETTEPATQPPLDTQGEDDDLGGESTNPHAVTSDDVKGWFAGIVDGEWVSEGDSQSENIAYERAQFSDGCTVTVVSHFGAYHHTEFFLSDGLSDMTKRAEEGLSAYIGRSLALSEREELASIIGNIQTDSPAAYLSSIASTATVYISRGEDGIHLLVV